ncbi:MAG: exo-alpha-sialidase [Gammaproteobacteria bacterium]|nr:exo-alpha-sialidase [Gammaproteobacteria bacterium]
MVKKVVTTVFGFVLVACTALLLQGCGNASSSPEIVDPAHLDSVKSLDVYVDGSTIHLLLAGPVGEKMAVRYLESTDGGKTWSERVAVPTYGKPPYGIYRGADAQIAASGKHLIAVWPTHGSGWGGSGPLVSAISNDGGKTWYPGPDPAGPGSTKAEGYVDIAADDDGVFHTVWLDSSTGRQGLHYARSDDGGRHWSPAQTIDAVTCECCWNTFLAAPDGRLYVLYRNIDPRDMELAVSTNGGDSWRQRSTVGKFGWDYKGCPETGGGLVVATGASQPVLRAVVWTGEQGQVGLHYLVSTDGGQNWKLSQRMGDTNARHSDMATLDGGHIAVVWDAVEKNGHSAIFVIESKDGGSTWSKPRQLSAPDTEGTHPRIVAAADGYTVFWTQADGDWEMFRLAD